MKDMKRTFFLHGFLTKSWCKGCIYHRTCNILDRQGLLHINAPKTHSPKQKLEMIINGASFYTGKRQMTKDNHLLGTFDLTGIPLAPRGVPQIKVTFEIDVNGILKVMAEDKGAVNKNDITIHSDRSLAQVQIERLINEAIKFAEEDRKTKERIDAKNEFKNAVYSMKTQISDQEALISKLTSEDKEKIDV
ncbi:hypothetical protein CHS0354_018274, partial [Potamilus streckersoni]